MKQQNYSGSITATVSIQHATDAISNVKGWWATNVKGNSGNLGDTFTVRFGKTFATITIIEVISGKKIVWQVIDCDLPLFANTKEWMGTKMVWDLSRDGANTNITMTHVGLTPALECFIDCEKGWSFFIKESLFRLLTENKGCPGTGIFAYIITNNRRYEGLIYYKQDPLPDYPDGFCVIDVMKTKGEQVTEAWSADKYQKQNFRIDQLKGDYFMIIENKSVFDNIEPLRDILSLVN